MTDTVLTQTRPEEAGLYPDQIDRIRDRAEEWAATDTTIGLVLLIARKGKIGFFETFGQQSFNDAAKPARDSMMHVASISKLITATAILQLVERGELSLNRLLKEYIPELTGKYTDRILVHQLLTHTSGFADLIFPPIFIQPEPTDVPCPEGQYPHIHRQLQMMYKMDCYKKPGTENMYCTENYMLLGEIVRRVTGQDIEAYSQENIFQPLGMNLSSFRNPDNYSSPLMQRDPAGFPFTTPLESMHDTPSGGGSLKSCAMDLAIFGQTYLNGGTYNGFRLLNKGTVAEMTRNQIPGIGGYNFFRKHIPEASWGLGWMIQGHERWPWSHGSLQPVGTIYHQGGTGCAMWVDQQNDTVGIYLSIVDRDMSNPNPQWEFDKFQNMATAAVIHPD